MDALWEYVGGSECSSDVQVCVGVFELFWLAGSCENDCFGGEVFCEEFSGFDESVGSVSDYYCVCGGVFTGGFDLFLVVSCHIEAVDFEEFCESVGEGFVWESVEDAFDCWWANCEVIRSLLCPVLFVDSAACCDEVNVFHRAYNVIIGFYRYWWIESLVF